MADSKLSDMFAIIVVEILKAPRESFTAAGWRKRNDLLATLTPKKKEVACA